jgi:hypothetical protein
MKKLALVLALTLTAFAGSALASEYWSNNVGVYFDEAGTDNCSSLPPFVATPAYLVFTDVTAATVKTWEIQLAFDNVTLLSLAPRGQNIVVSPRPGEYMVGLAAAQPVVGGTFVAADLSLLMLNTNAGSITANGVFFHLLDIRVPAFEDGDGVAYELYPISETVSPVMVINDGNCVVGTETTSFGEVKSLFR